MAVRVQPHQAPLQAGGPASPAPPTHGLTVVGWLVVCFAAAPLAMGAAGDGAGWGWGGLVMAVVGLALVLVGRRLRGPVGGS
jgi:hypothetical protein